MDKLSDPTKTLKIDDIPNYYPKRWVMVEITERDRYGWPVEGQVILSSVNKQELIQKTKTLKGDLYLFYTGRIDDQVA